MSTEDVDVFVHLRMPESSVLMDPSPIFGFLTSRGYQMKGEYVIVEEWPVQFLAPPGRLGEEAMLNAESVDAYGFSVRVFGAEYLAAIALETGRAKDKARLLSFLTSPAFDRKLFEAIVSRYALTEAWKIFKENFEIK
jgi:hypothetical protein